MKNLKKFTTNRSWKFVSMVVVFLAFAVVPVSNVLADKWGGGIAQVNGKAYGTLAAEWWQWAFDTEFSQFQNGEVDCSAGQSGKVWFLAGTLSGNPDERTCSIPKGKTLFFPLVNYGFWNPDDSCPEDQGFNCTVEQKRKNVIGFFSDRIPGNLGGSLETYACQLSAIVNGVHVQTLGYPIVHTQSPVFPLDQVGDPDTIDDGYYVAIPPLDEGEHTIKFTGGVCFWNQSPADISGDATPLFLVDITYTILVNDDEDEQ